MRISQVLVQCPGLVAVSRIATVSRSAACMGFLGVSFECSSPAWCFPKMYLQSQLVGPSKCGLDHVLVAQESKQRRPKVRFSIFYTHFSKLWAVWVRSKSSETSFRSSNPTCHQGQESVSSGQLLPSTSHPRPLLSWCKPPGALTLW